MRAYRHECDICDVLPWAFDIVKIKCWASETFVPLEDLVLQFDFANALKVDFPAKAKNKPRDMSLAMESQLS